MPLDSVVVLIENNQSSKIIRSIEITENRPSSRSIYPITIETFVGKDIALCSISVNEVASSVFDTRPGPPTGPHNDP